MSEKINNISEYIAENFGANASYVEGLLNRFKSDPNLVDESWRTFFSDLLNGVAPSESGNGQASTAQTAPVAEKVSANETATTQTAAVQLAAKTQPTVSIGADVEGAERNSGNLCSLSKERKSPAIELV